MSGYGTKVPMIKGHRQGGCAFQRKIRDKSERKFVALSNIAISVKQERLSRIITGFKESVFCTICTKRADDACTPKLVPRYLDVAQLSSADDPQLTPDLDLNPPTV